MKRDCMVVSIKNLRLEYRSGGDPFLALDVPAWEAADGAQVAVSGPSGSGKSTLLNVIAGLLPADSGSVIVCGLELAGLGEAERDRFRAEHLAYIFQTLNLLQGYTTLENVLLGATFSSQRPDRTTAKALLETVGLGHRLHHVPAELSIGEQQRVAIARALVRKPQHVVVPVHGIAGVHSARRIESHSEPQVQRLGNIRAGHGLVAGLKHPALTAVLGLD